MFPMYKTTACFRSYKFVYILESTKVCMFQKAQTCACFRKYKSEGSFRKTKSGHVLKSTKVFLFKKVNTFVCLKSESPPSYQALIL